MAYIKKSERTAEQTAIYDERYKKARARITGGTQKSYSKKGFASSAILWFIQNGMEGEEFFTTQSDNHVQALATQNGRKLSTTRVLYFPKRAEGQTVQSLTKITLLNDIPAMPEQPELSEMEVIQVKAAELDKLWKAYNSKMKGAQA